MHLHDNMRQGGTNDKFCTTITELINNMEQSMGMIAKWLKDSGLKVNKKNTELCLNTFSR